MKNNSTAPHIHIPQETLDEIREAIEKAKEMWDSKPSKKETAEDAYKRAMEVI